MTDDQFTQPVQLFDNLGKIKLRSGNSLRAELCLGQEISLWDVVAPHLVLYRFPRLYLQNAFKPHWSKRFLYFIRPYLSFAAGFKDLVRPYRYRNDNACQEWSSEIPTILFLAFTPRFYRDVLHSVVELLITKYNTQVIVLRHSQDNLLGQSSHNLCRFQCIWDHWNNDISHLCKSMIDRLNNLYNVIFREVNIKTLSQFVRSKSMVVALRQELKWLFLREFRRLIPHIAITKHILKQHEPMLIVSADDADQRCRTYSLLAGKMDIPSIVIQQGLTRPGYPDWLFLSHKNVAAMGDMSRRHMIEQNIPDERIVVTGHPGFDRLIVNEADESVNMRHELGILSDDKMVLFASQPYFVGAFNSPHIRKVMIKAVIEAVTSIKNMRLIIKKHPSEDKLEFGDLIGRTSNCVIVDQTMNISQLIKSCDILVTFFSTSALEALYANKPVINVAFSENCGPNMYIESGATWIARSQNDIVTLLKKLTGENGKEEIAKKELNRQIFITKWAHSPDGHATDRVVEVILSLIRKTNINYVH